MINLPYIKTSEESIPNTCDWWMACYRQAWMDHNGITTKKSMKAYEVAGCTKCNGQNYKCQLYDSALSKANKKRTLEDIDG